jgi:hypothetical protein
MRPIAAGPSPAAQAAPVASRPRMLLPREALENLNFSQWISPFAVEDRELLVVPRSNSPALDHGLILSCLHEFQQTLRLSLLTAPPELLDFLHIACVVNPAHVADRRGSSDDPFPLARAALPTCARGRARPWRKHRRPTDSGALSACGPRTWPAAEIRDRFPRRRDRLHHNRQRRLGTHDRRVLSSSSSSSHFPRLSHPACRQPPSRTPMHRGCVLTSWH